MVVGLIVYILYLPIVFNRCFTLLICIAVFNRFKSVYYVLVSFEGLILCMF